MTHRGPFQPRTFCDSVTLWFCELSKQISRMTFQICVPTFSLCFRVCHLYHVIAYGRPFASTCTKGIQNGNNLQNPFRLPIKSKSRTTVLQWSSQGRRKAWEQTSLGHLILLRFTVDTHPMESRCKFMRSLGNPRN